jgi:hypothetical protein
MNHTAVSRKQIANLDVRENQTMKNATKKKPPAKKKYPPAKKKK